MFKCLKLITRKIRKEIALSKRNKEKRKVLQNFPRKMEFSESNNKECKLIYGILKLQSKNMNNNKKITLLN